MPGKATTSKFIRNVAVIGHSSTGKTSLISAFLFDTKEINRLGKVDKGSSTTDFDEEAVERKITIGTAAAHAMHRGCKLNVLDTPGYSIFTTEAVQGIRVAEAALVVVSAVAGPEVQTEKLWKVCAADAKPILIAVNLMDRERASASRATGLIQKKFGREAVPIQLPIGEEHGFVGVVDLVHMTAFTFAGDESGSMQEIAVPAESKDDAEAARAALIEMVAEQDEALLEKFFTDGTLANNELAEGLAKAVATRRIFPIMYCSGGRNQGVQPILDALVDLVPNPLRVTIKARNVGGDEVELTPKESDTPIAYVFKTFSDPFAGRITLLRVLSGEFAADGTFYNRQRDAAERFGPVNWMQGKELMAVEKLVAGDIGAVAKLKETRTGDTLTAKDGVIIVPAVAIPEAAISFAVTPKAKGDEDRVAQGLQKLVDEDPTLHIGRDPQTKEQLVAGAGQLHVEIAVSRLHRRNKVDVTLQPPKVPYRETITRSVEITARHKKQSGGHGQFAEAKVRMDPKPRGTGYEFIDKIFGGSIPNNYRPSIDKGIQDAASRGALAGNPVVDFSITLLDGKFHPVDSSDMAFQICGRKAFRDAVKQAGATILEPVMQVEITGPDDTLGDVMGDLNSRRGRVQGMDAADGQTVVKAQVPLSEMLTYSQTLRSITGGRGDFHMEYSHYDEVPRIVQEKIIAAAGVSAEEEEDE